MHQCIQAGWVESCHDLAEGGLAVALAEMAMGAERGARVDLARIPGAAECSPAASLFAESPTRFLVEVQADQLEQVLGAFRTLPIACIGEVLDAEGPQASVHFVDGDREIASASVEDLLKWNRAES